MRHPHTPGDSQTAAPAHRRVQVPLRTGEEMPATLHLGRNSRAAVLLISDIRGPGRFFEELAARLADAGLAVLVPDYFFRQGPVAGPDIEDAKERRRGLDERRTLDDLHDAADWLAEEFATVRLGVLGFCMGGTLALDLASTRDNLVTVAYYGFPVPADAIVMPPPRPLDLVDTLRGPVLAFWGDQDTGVGRENMRDYIEAASRSNAEFEGTVLEGLGHGFLLRADLDDPTDAGGATWERTLAHFRANLMARRRPSGGGTPRVRLPRRALTVESVTRHTPLMVRVRARGDLAGWDAAHPGAHVKIFVPDGDDTAMRTYTVREADHADGTVTLDFGLHAEGPATHWARQARPGARIEIAGEARGGFVPKSSTRWLLLLADHCALPAVTAIVETLPAAVTALVVVELDDPGDADPVATAADVRWAWPAAQDEPGAALLAAAREFAPPVGPGEIWIGCEAGAMRELRRSLLEDGVIDRHRLHPRAYWKRGAANHSDHDTGDD